MRHTARALIADCEAACACERAWGRVLTLRGETETGASVAPQQQTQRSRAWVTLLSDRSYASGVRALYNSLQQADTEYPLIVMVTPSVPPDVRNNLAALGSDCIVREVDPLPLPAGTGGAPNYACAHFADCWAKLRMWEWEDEFDRLCYLDADMLLLKNMDELLEADDACEDGDGGSLAAACRAVQAVQECFCPVLERKHLCAYRQPAGAPVPWAYFNAGLLVLRPCVALLAHMRDALAAADLAAFPFAEQDFLNRYFAGVWRPLPWVYNASKALYACHRGPGLLWDLSAVKNVHYTMAKPWDLRHQCHQGYERLNELWHAAFAEPQSLARVTLRAVLQEKRALRESASNKANAAS